MLLQKKPAPAAPVSQAGALLRLMQQLTAVLEEEIALVESRKYTKHGEILKRKQELGLAYQAALKTLAGQTDKTMRAEEKAQLQQQGKILEAVTLRNAKALRIAQATSERLLTSIMTEVRKGLQKESGYSNNAILVAAQKDSIRPVAYSNRV